MSPETKTTVDLSDLRIEHRPPRRGGSRVLLVLVVLALMAGSFYLGRRLQGSGGGGLGGSREVRVEGVGTSASRRAAARSGSFSEGGWIEVPSYHPIVVSALVPGRVEKLLVLEGAEVGLNQPVALLYAKDRKDAVRQRQAAVAEANARLDLLLAGFRTEDVEKARADLERREEDVRLAEKILARTRELLPSGAASVEDEEKHESAVRVAKAEAGSATHELARLTAGYRKEEIAAARAAVGAAEAARDLAQSEVDYCTVKSPAKGVVLERFVTPGTWISKDNPRVVALYDPADLQVRVDVRQENAGRLKVGQATEVTTDAEPDRVYPGKVIRVDPLADLRKNTVQAKIKLTETGPGLHPEMICTARFVVDAPQEPETPDGPPVLTVRSSCLLREGAGTFVFVVRDGKARRVAVRTGDTKNDRIVIEAGVAAGDRVVVDPPPGLADGESVREKTE